MIRKCLLSGLHSALLILTSLGGIAIYFPTSELVTVPLPYPSLVSGAAVKPVAKAITVKIISKGFLGTGTLINKRDKIYTVITNDHVLTASEPTYEIQTPDGRIYLAEVSQVVKFGDDDLGLLQFTTDQVYQIAAVSNSSALTVGDEVFASGFTGEAQDIIFTHGHVSLLLDKSLEGGYQLGYTNDIHKGMSGGPIFNIQGEVVGINGLHNEPLWDAPDLYADGSLPCQPLQEMITASSWAIPIEKVAQLAPNFVQLKLPQLFILSLESKKHIDYTALQMRVKAATAKSCTLLRQ
ncbi:MULTISPECIES: serine protease [unclassified Nodularia (in: cyanobacteria)]|uniref:S1 family peptidase n=1 Tax=unclassified Nodularia (in: cyanobacteria) TaxID=2656917 RepID=UPI001881CACE|nr:MULTISPECIES: serine protease [unclassified Nodularia (in: cyanobacteria)]MBE9199383.1 trypsin-like peptidase domain-containing protein [Nodularia sp. LEGE 06071]MCC2695083.1 trypsin-like peptidase domain-containing protein [Nodularia sp. LEGE 04288]